VYSAPWHDCFGKICEFVNLKRKEVKKIRGTFQRVLRLSSGYGIGILTQKGKIFAISTGIRADQSLVEAVRGFELLSVSVPRLGRCSSSGKECGD